MLFLQNHDQVGNRPFGDRLVERVDAEALEAAIALLLLCPQIRLIFMGEEGASRTPFLFFTDHHGELAKAVRDGRRREFAAFAGFHDGETAESIPIPTRWRPSRAAGRSRTTRTGARCIASCSPCAPPRLVPHLAGARSISAEAGGPACVAARWRLGNGAVLALFSNLGRTDCAVDPPKGDLLFETPRRRQ